MISYLQAVRELDARWSFSLQFLPRQATRIVVFHDCVVVARSCTRVEIDLFNRYSREIAEKHDLNLGLLVDLYDRLLIAGVLEDAVRCYPARL